MVPTKRQLDVLRFISAYIGEHGYAPSFAEIAANVGLAHRSAVHASVERLTERGLINRVPYGGLHRNLSLTEQGRRLVGDVNLHAAMQAEIDRLKSRLALYEPVA